MTDDDEITPADVDHTPDPGEDFEADVLQLLLVLRRFLLSPEAHAAALQEALDNVAAWYEDDDPRSMGWVDDMGRP